MRTSSPKRAGSGIRLAVVVVLAAVLVLLGCYRVRSQLLATQMAPEEVYRCVQLELGRAGYAIVGADRASGWLHAQRRIQVLLKTRMAEIYATVIPDESDGGSQLQLTDNSHAEEDAERIQARCAPSAGFSAGE